MSSNTFQLPPAASLLSLFIRLFAWLCVVAGLVVFAVAGGAYLRSRPFGDGVIATAIVVDNHTVDVQGTPNYRPVVEFDVDGTAYQVAAVIAESQSFANGRTIDVSYLPGEPEKARVIAPGVRLMRTAAAVGGIGAVVGIVLLLAPTMFRLGGESRTDLDGGIDVKESDEI